MIRTFLEKRRAKKLDEQLAVIRFQIEALMDQAMTVEDIHDILFRVVENNPHMNVQDITVVYLDCTKK